jgi:hypothetical protein
VPGGGGPEVDTDEPTPLELPDEVRAELDAMPPERRHAWLDRLRAEHAFQVRSRECMLRFADGLDGLVDGLRGAIIGRFEDQPEDTQNEFLDYLMARSMRAEWARATARGDVEAAQQYQAKAEDYEERSKDFTIRFPEK